MIKIFKDQRAASEAMAKDFKAIANRSVDEQGRFTVSLTGGSSPLMLHEILSSKPYIDAIPWERTYVLWGDERSVPFDDPQNNGKMGFDTLLNHVPVPSNQIFRMNSEVPVEEAAKEYENVLRSHFTDDVPSFDLILLGMGSDGHTASLFPGSTVIHEKEKWVSTGYNPEQKTERITLTALLLNQAKNIFFAVFGDSKAETLMNVLHGQYNPEVFPAQLIKPLDGEVTWYIDEKAGAHINKS